jgi:hypothetical protein
VTEQAGRLSNQRPAIFCYIFNPYNFYIFGRYNEHNGSGYGSAISFPHSTAKLDTSQKFFEKIARPYKIHTFASYTGFRIKKEETDMEFLLSHWHCILPIAGIAVAMLFMRDKSKDKDKQSDHRHGQLTDQYDEK